MKLWWTELSELQKALFVVAVAATLLMVVQIVLMLIGGGDTDPDACDLDASDPTDACTGHGEEFTLFGLRILTVRTVIAFFSLGSWTAFTVDYVLDTYAAVLIGLAAGIVAAFGMAYLMHLVMKLQNNGNIDVANSVGKTAEVYLTVPPAGTGEGKIHLHLQEQYVELSAVTDCADALPTGTAVLVTGVDREDVVTVRPTGDVTRMSGNR